MRAIIIDSETRTEVEAVQNGNMLCLPEHWFVEGEGCFYLPVDEALQASENANGVNPWQRVLEVAGQPVGYQRLWSNVWD